MKKHQKAPAQGFGARATQLFESIRPRALVSVEVLRSQIGIMHQHAPMGLLVNVIVAVAVGLSFLAPGKERPQLVWILGCVLLNGLRYADCVRHRNLSLDPERLSRARRNLRLGAALQGIMWGIAGTLLLPPAPLQQLFLIAVLSGMTAGAVLILCPIWSAYALFMVPAIIPLCIRLVGGPLLTQQLTGGLGLVYSLTMLFLAARTGRWLEDSLVALQEKEILTRHLQSANETMIQYHAQLEAAVAARTLELIEANAQLQNEYAAKEEERVRTGEREEAVRRAQKLESLGLLAGGIAHDFNNLLAGILGYVSVIQAGKEPGTPEYDQLQTIEQQIDSARGLTRQLLGFARGGTYEMRPWDLNQIVQSAVDLFGRTKREIEVVLFLHGQECVADCDRGQIEQVLINLFVNASQAMPEGGTLTVRTRQKEYPEDLTRPFDLPSGWYVEVEVQDTGIGMDEATQARIFDPFFTTKDLGGGSGLGLASVYGILKNHRGLVRVHSQLGHGATFTCALPRSKAPVIVRDKPRRKGTHRGEGTVLVVDDQEIIRTVSKAMLEMIGYGVLRAESGEEALAIFEANREQIKLVLLDMIMPGMSGKETFHRLRALDPHLPVILASGYSLGGEVDALLAEGCNGFIQKPFNVAVLAEKISQVLAPDDGALEPR